MRLAPYVAWIIALVLVLGTDPAAWTSAYLGREGDAAMTQLWLRDWLAAGAPARMLGFPWGLDPLDYFDDRAGLALLALPLRWIFGEPLGVNLLVLLGLAANTWGLRVLARALGASETAGWLVALPLTFNASTLGALQDGRPESALFVFACLGLARFVRGRAGLRDDLALFGWFALASLVAGRVAFLGILACALFAAVERQGRGRERLRQLAVLLPVLLSTPGLIVGTGNPFLASASTWSPWDWSGSTASSADGLSALDLGSRRAGTWRLGKEDELGFSAGRRELMFAEMLVVAAGYVLSQGVAARLGLVLAGMGLVLAAGPEVAGTPSPGWIALAKLVPPLRADRAPAEALMVWHLGAGVLSVGLWDSFGAYWRTRAAAFSILGFGWLAEVLATRAAPLDAWAPEVPEFYSCLAAATEGALIPLPADGTASQALYQSVHGRPVLAGLDGRTMTGLPDEARATMATNTFLIAIDAIVDGETEDVSIEPADQEAIGELGFAWVVLDKRIMLRDAALGERKALKRIATVGSRLTEVLGEPIYDDIDTSAWAPWGGESPCGRSTSVEPDTTPMMDEVPEDVVIREPGQRPQLGGGKR
ncbi:MAG: hypothetical protein FJ102_23985 [Deltaproteobacteria bacterium]|nr:hypothetical protein [Deltaproteobacteria bacterium]